MTRNHWIALLVALGSIAVALGVVLRALPTASSQDVRALAGSLLFLGAAAGTGVVTAAESVRRRRSVKKRRLAAEALRLPLSSI